MEPKIVDKKPNAWSLKPHHFLCNICAWNMSTMRSMQEKSSLPNRPSLFSLNCEQVLSLDSRIWLDPAIFSKYFIDGIVNWLHCIWLDKNYFGFKEFRWRESWRRMWMLCLIFIIPIFGRDMNENMILYFLIPTFGETLTEVWCHDCNIWNKIIWDSMVTKNRISILSGNLIIPLLHGNMRFLAQSLKNETLTSINFQK